MDKPHNLVSLDALVNDDSDQVEARADHPRKLFAEADVVYAVDPDQPGDILVLGREKLREIAESDVPQGARVVRVDIGGEPQLLQDLLALVQQSRGYHDYNESA